ncbi:hypothetical protein A3A84_00990 [Candidatus Collierbacteria bacterium RIFCSPLOWO2_01_FULL_50_23]|uniref:Peptidase C39-like domain-containing protein n=2 Tax=Candidatus Collieribacteriota TaxID=1752725 RepID=A0A1F5ERV4_9BACT|nr:MAG: hypothetical protein A3D09_04115 [Candidatus Collierbacteria bacterium RIFCSPHIGHO2_02_FULL_49_10]OGD71361.1 MAG: hypothetical protein A2703_03535 [Candidatus Collierbacteria bacterium RIFCSPHIGHO2_01_FULL_50_25]OGD74028.1 MAG: hypothetical protein A3A84_00990 [Candidatus Collierbacteria bacterium RIFCSPLOWO2_01_FULL_50_23]
MTNFGNIFFGDQHLFFESVLMGIIAFGVLFFLTTSLLHFRKIVAAIVCGLLLFITATIFWTALLLPAPRIVRTIPGADEAGFPLNRKIEFIFDRPVSRAMLSITMTPEVAGKWIYENSVVPNHLMRRLVFYPTQTLPADTEFTVTLKGIQNVTRVTLPFDAIYKFTTQESPKLARIEPANNEKGVKAETKIDVFLTAPNGALSQLNFELSPGVPFEVKADLTRTHLTVIPKQPLGQGTRYRLTITKADLARDLKTNEVIKTGPESQIYSGYFTTKEAAGIDSFAPTGNKVSSRQPVTIRFGKTMLEAEVRKNFSIFPPVEGSSLLIDGVIFVFTPKKYDFNTTYTAKLAKGVHADDGSFLPEDLIHTFTTLGSVAIEKTYPRDGALGSSIKTPVKITFDQDVEPDSAENSISFLPKLTGKFSWEGKTMIFTPDKPLNSSSKYAVKLVAGIKSTDGMNSNKDYNFSFDTDAETTILTVPLYLQQHSLSCEVASLRMALAYRQVMKSEDELLAEIGVDSTPRQGNVWGDPYSAFVGNVNGKQMSTGYGVYWGPIARVAKNYRSASEFSGWSAAQVMNEVKKGNPVIIWTFSKNGTPTFWFTPAGEKIYAVAGEHTVVVVGYVGSAEDPDQVIVNDSLEGKVYWPRATFDKKFAAFTGSGVVVY